MRARPSQQVFGIAVAVCLGSCSPKAEEAPTAETSWSLDCHGPETVEIVTQGEAQTKAGNTTRIRLQWNAEVKTLALNDDVNEPIVFCPTPAPVNTKCEVRTDGEKLIARRTSLRPGGQPNSAIGFTEQIDLDLGTLKGKSRIGYKMGSIGEGPAQITQQMLSTAELSCSRAG